MRRRCRHLAGALAAAVLAAAPVFAADRPARWTRGAAVWSTAQPALDTFLATGQVQDRGLERALRRTGWSPAEIRDAMNKLYSVELAALERFLRSPAGDGLLRGRAGTYFPYWSQGATGVQALRAAILADAADGRISSASILARLPTDMRATPGCASAAAECPPLITWWVFLPARLQAGQSAALLSRPSAAGVPAAGAAAGPAGR